MSIKVNNISKKYADQFALDDISFEVNPGEVVGFLGPNGAGKSTMMKILTCFIPQSNGEATVCGYDVRKESIEVRKNIGYLPEHNPLYLDMYIKEYLEFIADLHKIKNKTKRISEMVEITGLQAEQNKKIGTLSKGYRQRVGLAQAMIHDPKVLILDEPTTGLDPNQLEEIRNLIIEVGKQKTVLLSTHIMQEVEAVCSQVIIINKGKIVANESTSSLQNSGIQNQQVIFVEFDKAISLTELKNIKGVSEVINIKGNTWQFMTTSDKEIRNEIFQFAVQKGMIVLTLQKQEQKLEDVFKNLTN